MSVRIHTLIVAGSLIAIAASSSFIYRYYHKPLQNMALHQRVGEVMAEQTAKVLGSKGHILLITIPTAHEPELATQLAAFREKLKTLGEFHIKDHELDPKGQAKYGVGRGLSARRFLRAVNNHSTVDAIVSFVGVPDLSDNDIAALKRPPKFIAETRSPDYLPKLFEKQLIQAVVSSRFTFPAPGPLQPSSAQEWFDKRYEVLTAQTAKISLQ